MLAVGSFKKKVIICETFSDKIFYGGAESPSSPPSPWLQACVHRTLLCWFSTTYKVHHIHIKLNIWLQATELSLNPKFHESLGYNTVLELLNVKLFKCMATLISIMVELKIIPRIAGEKYMVKTHPNNNNQMLAILRSY